MGHKRCSDLAAHARTHAQPVHSNSRRRGSSRSTITVSCSCLRLRRFQLIAGQGQNAGVVRGMTFLHGEGAGPAEHAALLGAAGAAFAETVTLEQILLVGEVVLCMRVKTKMNKNKKEIKKTIFKYSTNCSRKKRKKGRNERTKYIISYEGEHRQEESMYFHCVTSSSSMQAFKSSAGQPSLRAFPSLPSPITLKMTRAAAMAIEA